MKEEKNCSKLDGEEIEVFNRPDLSNEVYIRQSIFTDEQPEIVVSALGALKLAEMLIENAHRILDEQQTLLKEVANSVIKK